MKCCPECKNLNIVKILGDRMWCRNCNWTSTDEPPRLAPEKRK